MSFCAAVYDTKARDVVIGADRRWCCPPDVRFNNCYHPVAEDAVKCLRLTEGLGIAFTGAAALIRSVLSSVYGDTSILSMDEMRVGEMLEGRDLGTATSMPDVVACIDAVLPGLMANAVGTLAEGDLSAFLAGRDQGSGNPHVVYWCRSTNWRGRPYPMSDKALRTLPPECNEDRDFELRLTKNVDAILNNAKVPPIARVKNAITHLAHQDWVVSVNDQWIVRSLKRKFVCL